MSLILFISTLLGITIYSWGFVDQNVPFVHIDLLRSFVFQHRELAGGAYILAIAVLWAWYGYTGRRLYSNKLPSKVLYRYLILLCAVLFFSYPAFSNDVFNYMATAKIAFLYHENPYVVMPIEISNEPFLTFMHAANKTALYGPVWIVVTVLPYIVGFGNPLITMYAFKLVVIGAYLLLLRLIYLLSKSHKAVWFFAFNPLVVVETLVSAHNDVVMMALALWSFFLLKNRRYVWAFFVFSASVLIKGATVFLIPALLLVLIMQKKGKIAWSQIWTWALYGMLAIVILSPLREELYSWYLIWPLTFVALRGSIDLVGAVVLGASFGLPLRFLPFIVTRNWSGVTPAIKSFVTCVPPAVAGMYYILVKKTQIT